MTKDKAQRLLQGQSAQVQKVYPAVPTEEAWTPQQIVNALKLSGAMTTNIRVLKVCLLNLRDIGLIREVKPDQFQRVAVSTKPQKVKEVTVPKANAAPITAIVQKMPGSSNEPAPATKLSGAEVASREVFMVGGMDAILGLNKEIQAFATDFSVRLAALVARVEEVAMAVGEELETSAGAANRLKKLQELLRD